MRHLPRLVSFAGIGLAIAMPARAELVFFTTGRSLSVKSHRADGEALVLVLRDGGEVEFDRSLVTRIEPDEVPYPEPESPPKVAETEPDSSSDIDTISGLQPELARYIDTLAAKHHVPARLVKAVIQVESGYQRRARSRKGAMGLMQLMPQTAREYAVADPYDARANVEAGIRHLEALLQKMPLRLALAAYNAGEAAVQRFGGVPPYRETQDYVSRILKLFGRTTL